MPQTTIKDAVQTVIKESGQPMTAQEAHDAIVARNLYEFGAKQPVAIVQTVLRRHTEGVDLKKSSPEKLFRLTAEKRYTVI